MTKEEAREILQQIRKQKCVSECDCGCKLYELETFCLEEKALDMAIKALEQQPCEDAISREQAVYIASGYCAPQNIADELRKLPSVTSQPKTGHWIDGEIESDDCKLPIQICSECNTFYPLAYTGGGHKYCPNCGAKMESEDE